MISKLSVLERATFLWPWFPSLRALRLGFRFHLWCFGCVPFSSHKRQHSSETAGSRAPNLSSILTHLRQRIRMSSSIGSQTHALVIPTSIDIDTRFIMPILLTSMTRNYSHVQLMWWLSILHIDFDRTTACLNDPSHLAMPIGWWGLRPMEVHH